jgi:hypothetical protein
MPNAFDRDQPRRPVSEPEILAPGDPDPRLRQQPDETRARAAFYAGNGQRIFLAQPSPWTMILALLGVGAAVGIVVMLLVGFVLMALPVIGAVVAGIILLRLLGAPRRGGPPARRNARRS